MSQDKWKQYSEKLYENNADEKEIRVYDKEQCKLQLNERKVIEAVKKLKVRKAGGLGGFTSKMLQTGPRIMIERFQSDHGAE